MKKALAAVLVVSGAAMLSGCLTAPVMPPMGIIYTSYRAPLDFDQEGAEGTVIGSKEGMAHTTSILGLVAQGDASIVTAAKNGEITKVHGADYDYFNVLGVYQKYTTIVRGE
jgi:hypothetical protein